MKNAPLKINLFNFLYSNDLFKKNSDELKDLGELDNLQSKVKHVRLFEKIGKQGFH